MSLHTVDETELHTHIAKLIAGIGSKDVEALRRLYAPDVVSFDVEPPLQHVGVDAKMANWTRAFAFFRDLSYEVRDLSFTVGGDVAFGHCFGRLSGTLPDGAATPGMWVRATFCLRRLDGVWQITHDQASVPFDIATGKGVTDLQP